MSTAIELSSISKVYPRFTLQPIDLVVPSGSTVGLLGRNGAGKTTLLRCVLNLVRRDSGQVRLPGCAEDISGFRIRRVIGYVPERLIFYEWMTVRQQLRFVSRFYDNWDEEHCHRLLERYQLDAERKIRELSSGMRTKLALLLALSHHPRVLLLDEPTSGLDPVMRHQFLQDLRRLVSEGDMRAIVIASHNLDEVSRVADRIAIIREGVLAADESKEGLLERWCKILFTPGDGQAPLTFGDFRVHSLGDRQAVIVPSEESAALARRLEESGANRIEVARADLQDVFLQVV